MAMQYVEANGARIPPIGLGTWDLRGRTCARVVEQALRLGYRHVDTAEMYGNEREVGEGLRASGGAARRRLHHHQGVAGSSGAGGVRARRQGEPRRAAPLRGRSPADPLAQPAHSARRDHRRAVPDEAGGLRPAHRHLEFHGAAGRGGGEARDLAARQQPDRVASLSRPGEGRRRVPPARPVGHRLQPDRARPRAAATSCG